MSTRGASGEAIWEIHDKQEEIEGLDALGRPDPKYAAALGLVSAPLGRRVLAAFCDGLIILVLQLPLWLGAVPLVMKFLTGTISLYGLLNHPSFVLAVVMAAVTVALTLITSIVQWVMHARAGMTIGKAIAGIRTVNVATLRKPGAGRVLGRYLLLSVSGMIPVVGSTLFLISPLFDSEKRRRGWHDKASKVWLVDVRKGLHPYDEKRMRVARKMLKANPVVERSAIPSLATSSDPAAQQEYRPGSRISAGVLGVARPHDPARAAGTAAGVTRAADVPSRPSLATPAAEVAAPLPAPVAPQPPITQTPLTRPPVSPAPAQRQPAPSADAAPAVLAEPRVVPVPPQATVAAPVAPVASAPVVQAPVVGTVPQQASPAQSATIALRLDTGETIPVSGAILLGRGPDAGRHPGAKPIPLTDASRSLSKTHLFVRPVPGGLEVVDLQSTNGSAVVRGGVEQGLVPGVAVQAVVGDVVRLGDRTAEVIRV